jgi:hypothetical protein
MEQPQTSLANRGKSCSILLAIYRKGEPKYAPTCKSRNPYPNVGHH